MAKGRTLDPGVGSVIAVTVRPFSVRRPCRCDPRDDWLRLVPLTVRLVREPHDKGQGDVEPSDVRGAKAADCLANPIPPDRCGFVSHHL